MDQELLQLAPEQDINDFEDGNLVALMPENSSLVPAEPIVHNTKESAKEALANGNLLDDVEVDGLKSQAYIERRI